MRDSNCAFALETAACLWEAVLSLRDSPVTNPADIERALLIREPQRHRHRRAAHGP
jgi:hypothetical protein